MNVRSLFFPVIYSLLSIISISITFYGGFTKYLNIVTILAWLFIIPFCVASMIDAKKIKFNNQIGGKELSREGLKFLMVSTLILVVFQIIFFNAGFKAYKINFIQTYGVELAKLQIKNGHLTIKDSEIPKLINEEIKQVTLFKECTSIVFKNLFLGVITVIISSVILRKKTNLPPNNA
ncbi:MAG: DUF4199 domain-containing protein [Bacteroidota bacterium]